MENDEKIKVVNTTDSLKEYKNARVLWPPDCSDDILDKTLSKARRLLDEFDIDSEGVKIAEKLKKYMDENYNQFWHVICGRHFGCYAIHESNHFIYFYVNSIAFLLYKAG